ncbi:hypothetical protein [Cyclobacterium qasimii]|uniref:Transglutaminase-like domain-containing protein n=1 Tax=Cyclobacterium qasimii TaxID=1350429 RepID=A0A512CCK7_9BACT|nr:hypothetical protein [Cyclobacterium qasimii]GEO21932.1 hypothetical protein CQA01_24660 [Cyclobacterium qasimii]
MHKALSLLVLLLMASVSETVQAKNHAYLSTISTPSEPSSLLKSWRMDSEDFTILHEQLNKDFSKFGRTKKMVKNIFYRSHQRIFRNYEQFSMAQDTFTSGAYDCVSGSLILAGLLEYFGFEFDIIETTYHVFLKVEVANEDVILEVTDPLTGFISDDPARKTYLAKYSYGENISSPWGILASIEGANTPAIFRKIDLQSLIGLQYFNQAINHYNKENELLAYQFSVSALKMYKAERIIGFSEFLKHNLLLSASR